MSSFVNTENIFELSGGREMVTAARATELLESARHNGDDVNVIRLSNKSFGQEAAEIVAERIRYVNTYTYYFNIYLPHLINSCSFFPPLL